MATPLPAIKKPRRPKGEGSLKFRADKGLWVFTVQLPPGPGGKRRRRTFYGKTSSEAKNKAIDEAARRGGKLTQIDPMTLADYVGPWLARVQDGKRPKTAEACRWAWSHAGPLIGHVRLDQFESGHAGALFHDLLDSGRSANTVRHVARVMTTIFADAIAAGKYRGAHPFKLAARLKPSHKPAKGRALSVAEARRFIAAAREDRLEAAWLLGLLSGLRIGEMYGLQWGDIDFNERTVFVRRQAVIVNGKVQTGPVKTDDGERLLPMGDLVLAALQRRRIAASEERESEWIFPSADPSKPISPNNARRRNFAETKTRAGIGGAFTPHDLRHTYNSIANAAGVVEKVRSEMMGHADSTITRKVYTHTIDGQARDAASRIDAMLE